MRDLKKGDTMKKFIKGAVTIFLAGAMVLSLASCRSTNKESQSVEKDSAANDGNETDTSSAAENKVFRLGVNGSNETGFLMELAGLAYKSGYLEEELNEIGFDLEISAMAGGPVINEALAAGELDAAIYGDFPAFTSKSNEIDTTVVANLNSQFQIGLLTANEAIQEPKDLEGKRVIIQIGTSVQYFWEKYVEHYGLDESKIEIINASSDTNSLLTSGEADVYVSSLYSVKYMESLGVGTVFDDGSAVTEGVTTFVFEISTELLKENPDVGVAVCKALICAYDEAVENPDALYEAVSSEYMGADIMASEYAFDTSLSYLYPEITDDLMEYYQELNDWLYENQIITSKVDVNSYFDNSYFEAAYEEVGKE